MTCFIYHMYSFPKLFFIQPCLPYSSNIVSFSLNPLRSICDSQIFMDIWASTGAWLIYQRIHFQSKLTLHFPATNNCHLPHGWKVDCVPVFPVPEFNFIGFAQVLFVFFTITVNSYVQQCKESFSVLIASSPKMTQRLSLIINAWLQFILSLGLII